MNEHNVKPACDPNVCPRKCSTKISEERRRLLNDEFWKLTADKDRKSFVLHHISSYSPKQRTTTFDATETSGFKKQKSLHYSLKNDEGMCVTVCKTFFLATLGFHQKNDRIIRSAIENAENSVSPPEDRRRRKQPHNKMNDNLIRNHIESFNPEVAHYRREHAPRRTYLPSGTMWHRETQNRDQWLKIGEAYARLWGGWP